MSKGHYKQMCRSKVEVKSERYRKDSIRCIEINAINNGDNELKCEVVIAGERIEALIDTGAVVNVIPKRYLNQKLQLNSSGTSLRTWTGEKISTLGTITAEITAGHRTTSAEFYITEKGSQPLLSFLLAKELNLIGNINTMNANSKKNHVLPETIQQKLHQAFQEKGSQIKREPCRIEVIKNAKPVKIPTRRIPIAYHDEVRRELQEMERNGIIEKSKQAVDWCSPLVITHKKSGKLRICIDYIRLNECVRTPCRQIPTIEEIQGKIGRANYFTTLDMTNGYWQVEVHKDDRDLLTFGTPCGTYTFKRLPFRLKSAPMIFQEYVTEIIGELPGVVVYLDDILIATETKEGHLKTFETVLDKLINAGVALNANKCQIG